MKSQSEAMGCILFGYTRPSMADMITSSQAVLQTLSPDEHQTNIPQSAMAITWRFTINGIFENEVTDRKYNLSEGQVGFSVSSFDVTPIIVNVDYFSIDLP